MYSCYVTKRILLVTRAFMMMKELHIRDESGQKLTTFVKLTILGLLFRWFHVSCHVPKFTFQECENKYYQLERPKYIYKLSP